MLLKKLTSVLVSTTLLSQAILPTFAMEQNDKEICDSAPYKAPLTVMGEKGKTGAGIFHYANIEGDIHFLLGERDDNKGCSNLGGGSDEGETLDETAARESKEESNGIYAPHPRILKSQPFIDTIVEKKGSPFLHRLYFQRIQYISPDVFIQKMNDPNLKAHNKEYTKFYWIKGFDLLSAVISGESETPIGSQIIQIYEPLFQTLSTDSGRLFLNKLTVEKKLTPTFVRVSHDWPLYFSIKNYFNLCYQIGSNFDLGQFYGSSKKLPVVLSPENSLGNIKNYQEENKKQDQSFWKLTIAERNTKAKNFIETYRFSAFGVYKHCLTAMALKGENANKLDKNLNIFLPIDLIVPPNTYEIPLLFDDKNADDSFAYAISAHGMAMVELKRRFQSKIVTPLESKIYISDLKEHQQWNPHCEETLSRIHLRMVLGELFKEPSHYPKAENSQRSADLANIKTYFLMYDEGDYFREHKNVEGRKIELLESDCETLADALAWEDKNRAWPTFFHGTSKNTNKLIKGFTPLKELSNLRPLDDLAALRGTDIYFHKDTTLWSMLKRTKAGQCSENNNAMMFLNFALCAGMTTTKSTSSSAEYFVNDHSVIEPNPVELFMETLALAGFSKQDFSFYESLFDQFFAYKNLDFQNSILLAITQNPEKLDKYMYPTRCGEFHKDLNGEEIKSTHSILYAIQAEYERQREQGTESFEVNLESKKALFPECRLFLHPNRMMNPEFTTIKSFDRFPLTGEEQKSYDQEMRKTTVALLADWLAQESTIMQGSFLKYPALKTLYKYAYKGLYGRDLKESTSTEGFMYLVRGGHVEAVQGYVDSYPEILLGQDVNPEELMKAAVEGKNLECVHYFMDKFPGVLTKDILDTKDKNGCTWLIYAAFEGKVDSVSFLVKNNADVNVFDGYYTPLGYAIRTFLSNIKIDLTSRIKLISILCSRDDIDPNIQDYYGLTALTQILCIEPHSFNEKAFGQKILWYTIMRDVLKIILSCKKIDLNIPCKESQYFMNSFVGKIPLECAIKIGIKELIEPFIVHDKIDSCQLGEALSWAIRVDDEKLFDFILAKDNFDVNVKIKHTKNKKRDARHTYTIGKTRYISKIDKYCHKNSLLLQAIYFERLNSVKKILACVDINHNYQDEWGVTAFSMAYLVGNKDIINLILSCRDIKPSIPYSYGDLYAPITSEFNYWDKDLVTFLETHGKMDSRQLGEACSWAIRKKDRKLFDFILAKDNFDVNVRIKHAKNKKNSVLYVYEIDDVNNRNENTLLLQAIYFDRLDFVKQLLSCVGIDLNCQNEWGVTPFSMAYLAGNKDIVSLIRNCGDIKPSIPDDYGDVSLSFAPEFNCWDKDLMTLLEAHGKMDSRQLGEACSWAITENDAKLFDLILSKDNFDVNINVKHTRKRPKNKSYYYQYGRNKRKNNLLLQAIYFDEIDFVKKILTCVDINLNQQDEQDEVPFGRACFVGNKQVIELLIEHSEVNPNIPVSHGRTALGASFLFERWDVAQLLLGYDKVVLNIENFNKAGKLWYVIARAPLNVLKILLTKKDIDPNVLRGDDTPLTWLMSKDVLKGVPQGDSRWNLRWNFKKDIQEIIKMLLAHKKIDPNLKNKQGKSPLLMAYENKNIDLAEIVLGHEDTDPNIFLENGDTLLMAAVIQNDLNFVRILLEYSKTNPNLRNKSGETVLDLAERLGNHEIVELLLTHPLIDSTIKKNT